MDRSADLQTFIAVAKTGSLSQAARQMGTAKSVVGRRLSDLEALLSARLVNWTARGSRVRAFIDFLRDRVGGETPWDRQIRDAGPGRGTA